MKIIISCLLAFTCITVQANELIIHGPSIHGARNKTIRVLYRQEVLVDGKTHNTYKVTKPYDNANYGIGYRTSDGYLFGIYNNSYSRPAAYVGKQVMFNSYLGAYAAVATGYDNVSGYPLALTGGLIVKLPVTERISLELMGFPKLGKIDGVLHAVLAYKF